MNDGPLQLTRGLKIAAGYFLVIGVVGVAWQLLGLGSPHPAFEGKTLAYRIGAYSREILISIAFIIVGASMLRRRSWVPAGAYIALAISTFYGGFSFAWGFSGEQPSHVVALVSLAVVGAWNSLWAFLVYRDRQVFAAPRQRESAA